MLPLAVAEGRRLLRHPVVLVGMELSLYLYFRAVASGPMPVGPRDGVQIAYALLPLAGATLLAANWAALRERRQGTEGLYDSLPMGAIRRTAARLLSLLAPVVLALAVTIGDLFLMRMAGGVGMPSPFELVAGPAVVALAGVLGVLLARLGPGFGLAPVVMVGLAASWYFPYLLYRLTNRVWIWHSFWLFPWYGEQGHPADWTSPYAGAWHLAYVGGLVGLTACLALGLSSGHRKVRVRTALATTLALALTVSGVVIHARLRVVSNEAARQRVGVAIGVKGTQECPPGGEVRYCAWGPYVPWISRFWERPIAGVWRRVPAGHKPVLLVRQMELGDFMACRVTSACSEPDDIRDELAQDIGQALEDSDVRPDAVWPRDKHGQGDAELGLAASAGARAVDLPTAPSRDSEPLTVCVPGEARAVVALWLAGQSTPLAKESLEDRVLGKPSKSRHVEPRARVALGLGGITLQWPWPEAVHALALLEHRPDEVAHQLQRDWSRWTSKGTPTGELVEAFGLPPVPAPANIETTRSPVSGSSSCDSGEVGHS